MGLRINTNVASINAQRQLDRNQKRSEHAMAALASGSRIVSASDDAAGLAISENLRGQLGGIRQARNNAFNAISLIEVSDGGLNEITNILVRLRELGVQAASDNVGNIERGFLDQEAQQLVDEANRISKSTRFGNMQLLDGSGEELEFQVGPFGGKDNVVAYKFAADASGDSLGYNGISVGTKDDARESLNAVDESLIKLASMRADFGAVSSRMQATVSSLDIQYENLSAAKSRLRDADVAYETAELAASQILQNASIAVLSQANARGSAALRLINI